MKFISVRDLRGRTSQLWSDLKQEKDFVVTDNGKPVAILTWTDGDSFERSLRDLRQSRANAALADLHREAAARGLDKLSCDFPSLTHYADPLRQLRLPLIPPRRLLIGVRHLENQAFLKACPNDL